DFGPQKRLKAPSATPARTEQAISLPHFTASCFPAFVTIFAWTEVSDAYRLLIGNLAIFLAGCIVVCGGIGGQIIMAILMAQPIAGTHSPSRAGCEIALWVDAALAIVAALIALTLLLISERNRASTAGFEPPR
ncbi:MAG: hypothetical protein ACREP6_05420, partial [Candidatus Binataceae bacterium]